MMPLDELTKSLSMLLVHLVINSVHGMHETNTMCMKIYPKTSSYIPIRNIY